MAPGLTPADRGPGDEPGQGADAGQGAEKVGGPAPEPASKPTPRPASRPAPRPASRLSRQVVGPFTLGHLVVVAATLVGIGALLVLLTSPMGTSVPTDGPPVPGASFYVIGEATAGLAIGQPAPELEGERDGQRVTLVDLDGSPVRLADLRGHPVWVNFWASWCPPCQQETPVLRALYQTHAADGLRMIGVSVQEASPDEVRRYVETYDVPYTVAFDGTSAVFGAWRGFGLPTHYLIDAEGVVRAVHYGPLSREAAETLLAGIMPRAASASPSEAASASP